MASKEGHPAYRSQSDNPLQGTTLGGSPDDPRRQRTRNAPAGHATRAGTRERQRGLPGAGDLAHPVLPVAPALRALWRRRRASAAAARAPWAPGAGAARDRTVGAQRGDQHSDLGLRADRGVPHAQLAAESRSKYGAAGFVRRAGLATRRARLTVLEHQAARTAGLLTERTRQRLWRARHGRTRHVEAAEPGELVCLDTFYIGNLKGVGKVWQITACDAASSYGVAALLPTHTAADAAAFLRDVLGPLFRRAGWPLRRVLTDGGPEFHGAFDEACRQLGLRHTRTQPRHAWTNGFVERLHGTILQEHWRIQFRRRYFTGRSPMQQSLEAFMRFYNEQRPHQGYRLRGRTPAEIFWGVIARAH